MTVRILVGHVLDRLADLPDESVHCVVTSPPYWGLRDYKIPPQVWGGEPGCAHAWGDAQISSASDSRRGSMNWTTGGNPGAKVNGERVSQGAFCCCGAWRGSLGLEPAPALYIAHLVDIFREVRRVLRRDGTLWLNIGDSYNGSGMTGGTKSMEGSRGRSERMFWRPGNPAKNHGNSNRDGVAAPGLKPKDLIGIPWMLAFALRDDGWYLRRDIIWSKPNPMPESVTDRCTTAHEYLFHFSKTAKYFYDAEAVREPHARLWDESNGGSWAFGRGDQQRVAERGKAGSHSGPYPLPDPSGRNKRSVWTIASEPFPEAHFATYPTALVEPCILAGTSAKGVCPKCAAPWVRVVEKSADTRQSKPYAGAGQKGTPNGSALNFKVVREEGGSSLPTSEITTLGWRPSCRCDAGAPIPATILDCFLGAGTTALVADRLGRDCIGIDLSADYAAMAEGRVRGDAPLFVEIAAL